MRRWRIDYSQVRWSEDGRWTSVSQVICFTARRMSTKSKKSPYVMYLTHFRSKELARLRPYGRFWHTFFTSGGWIVDQDEIDTFTSNLPIRDLDTDITKIDPKETVYENLGSFHAPFKFEIDEVLVSSAWRPNYCIADRYTSEGGRIILAGDSGKSHHHFDRAFTFNLIHSPSLASAWRIWHEPWHSRGQ